MYIFQCEIDDKFDYCIIKSIGYLISKDKEKYVIAGDIVDGDIRRVIVIPKENVIKIYYPNEIPTKGERLPKMTEKESDYYKEL